MGKLIEMTTRQVLPDRERVTSLDIVDGTSEEQKSTIGVLHLLPMQPKFKRLENGERQLVSTPATLANLESIFRLDPVYAGRFRLNRLSAQIEVVPEGGGPPVLLEDHFEVRLATCLAEAYKMDVTQLTRIHNALVGVSADCGYHPVRDYLNGLEWDGVERLDNWLMSYCGAPNEDLIQRYARRWAISCVARVMQPGAKVDTILILAGKQGSRKSSAFMTLGGAWYREGTIDPRDTKGSVEVITGSWIYEMGELDAFRRSEATSLKSFLSRQEDSFRPAYARNGVVWKRQTVMVGTTNEESFLSDSTGNRRYWPVRVGRIDIESLQRDRDQLWAEAVVAYRAGERWWFDSDEEAARADDIAVFASTDPWQDRLEDHWARNRPARVRMDEVSNILEIETAHRSAVTNKRIASVLQAMGFVPKRTKNERWWQSESG